MQLGGVYLVSRQLLSYRRPWQEEPGNLLRMFLTVYLNQSQNGDGSMKEEKHLEVLLVATSHQIFILESNVARLEISISESMAFEFSVLNYGEIRIQTEMLNHRRKELKDFRDAYLFFRGKMGKDKE